MIDMCICAAVMLLLTPRQLYNVCLVLNFPANHICNLRRKNVCCNTVNATILLMFLQVYCNTAALYCRVSNGALQPKLQQVLEC